MRLDLRRIQRKGGNQALLFLSRGVGFIPQPLLPLLGRALGLAIFALSGRHRRLVLENIRQAFGKERDERELRAIRLGFYLHMGKSLLEFLAVPYLSDSQMKRLVSLEGLEHLDAALERGKGVILLTAHLGNWELMGQRLQLTGHPVNALARRQNEPRITGLLNTIRTMRGMRVIESTGRMAMRECLRCLQDNQILGILADHNAGPRGVFVEFFGRPASSFAGPAALALRTGAAVVPGFCIRKPDDTYIGFALPAVALQRTADRHRDVLENTARFMRIIEGQIRLFPEQWFWLHRRWKSQPPGQGRQGVGP